MSYNTLWEFRVHKNGTTLHSGFKGQGDHHNINVGAEQFTVRIMSERMHISDTCGRYMTEYPLKYGKEYPNFTEIAVLMDNDRYLFEYRYTELT